MFSMNLADLDQKKKVSRKDAKVSQRRKDHFVTLHLNFASLRLNKKLIRITVAQECDARNDE